MRLTTLILIFWALPALSNEHSCKQRLKMLGSNWEADFVNAPLWHNKKKKSSETIRVYFYRKKLLTTKPNRIPILFINGGPTISSGSASAMFDKIPQLKNENIILMDQRGTGCSGDFPAYTKAADLKQYLAFTSASIVKDAEIIRETLFPGQKWKIWGQSFGGFTSFRYIELFPGSLHSAHIHGFGFTPPGTFLLDTREKKIQEITPQFLDFQNPNRGTRSIRELINYLKSNSDAAHETLARICIPTPGAQKNELCGLEMLDGLFLIVGFRNLWTVAHDKLTTLVELMEKNRPEKIEHFYRNFVNNYILRFNDQNQTNALNVITYFELIPGTFFYAGCTMAEENEIISECRFNRTFLRPIPETPTFRPRPINLKNVKKNIQAHRLRVNYYAGAYDTFLPEKLLIYTAKKLGLEKNLIIFPHSGHEGYYTESVLLKNLII